ncbi:hypothetical protein BC831DRAFT_459867 [Entophlyctis helioformis]|nr:hypothetical protein BC831DRAFT_459867 [Entophlyctis helioformis]
MTPLLYALLALYVVEMAVGVFAFVRFWRLPTTYYSLFLRISCVAILLALSLHQLNLQVPGVYSSATEIVLQVCHYSGILTFTLSQLEFLKVISPFMSSLSTTVITRLQICFLIYIPFAIILVFSALLPESLALFIFILKAINAIFPVASSIVVQFLLVYFVHTRFKRATRGYLVGYTAAYALGVIWVGLTMAITLTNDPKAKLGKQAVYINIGSVPNYFIIVFTCELLRYGLQRKYHGSAPTRTTAAPRGRGFAGAGAGEQQQPHRIKVRKYRQGHQNTRVGDDDQEADLGDLGSMVTVPGEHTVIDVVVMTPLVTEVENSVLGQEQAPRRQQQQRPPAAFTASDLGRRLMQRMQNMSNVSSRWARSIAAQSPLASSETESSEYGGGGFDAGDPLPTTVATATTASAAVTVSSQQTGSTSNSGTRSAIANAFLFGFGGGGRSTGNGRASRKNHMLSLVSNGTDSLTSAPGSLTSGQSSATHTSHATQATHSSAATNETHATRMTGTTAESGNADLELEALTDDAQEADLKCSKDPENDASDQKNT